MAVLPEHNKVTVSKLDAAKRQLDCAIEMWFRDADPVAVYTLSAAAHEIIHNICEKRGKGEGQLLYNSDRIKDEYREQWIALVRKPVNFFKHANRDPDGILEFNPSMSFYYCLFASFGLALLGERSSEMVNTLMYYVVLHDMTLIQEDFREKVKSNVPVDCLEGMREMTKAEFLKNMLLANAHIRAGTRP